MDYRYTRVEIDFEVDAAPCAGWLYRPVDTGRDRLPCVVMAHGFGMTRECRLPQWAKRFAANGLAVLLFDYRGFGASGGQPRQLLDIAAQRSDWVGAVAHARRISGLDPDRVALWGTSFSGGHVLHVAARDPRIAAVVAQVPFTDGRTLGRGRRPTPARARELGRLAVAAVLDTARRRVGAEPLLVPIAGGPGSGAVLSGPGVEQALRRLVPAGVAWRNEVNAGVVLEVRRDRPGRDADRIRCPLLVAVCADDEVTPAAPAEAAARTAPRGELRRYPFSHFEAYLGGGFEALCADQVVFFRRHLDP